MSVTSSTERCQECTGDVIDAGEEFVCTSCGVVRCKEVMAQPGSAPPQAIDFTGQSLGGYLGSADPTPRELRTRGLSGEHTSYRYLKVMSDYACREEGSIYTCAKSIERVCDRLGVPKPVMGHAVLIARRMLSEGVGRGGPTAAISAYSVIQACRSGGVVTAGSRDVVAAFRETGRKVKVSDLIKLAFESPCRAGPRRPEDCIKMIVARLGLQEPLRRSLIADGPSGVAFLGSVAREAARILETVEEPSKAGHHPCALAATAMYSAEVSLSRQEGRRPRFSQRMVARCAGVAEYTVREQYRTIFRPVLCPPLPKIQRSEPLLPPMRN